jgi:hypothetical protein
MRIVADLPYWTALPRAASQPPGAVLIHVLVVAAVVGSNG